MSYRIHVTVIHSLGEFKGYIDNDKGLTFKEAQQIRDQLQTQINLLENLTLEASDTSITLPQKILENSVFKFQIYEQ
jgi:hypothetical protein